MNEMKHIVCLSRLLCDHVFACLTGAAGCILQSVLQYWHQEATWSKLHGRYNNYIMHEHMNSMHAWGCTVPQNARPSSAWRSTTYPGSKPEEFQQQSTRCSGIGSPACNKHRAKYNKAVGNPAGVPHEGVLTRLLASPDAWLDLGTSDGVCCNAILARGAATEKGTYICLRTWFPRQQWP